MINKKSIKYLFSTAYALDRLQMGATDHAGASHSDPIGWYSSAITDARLAYRHFLANAAHNQLLALQPWGHGSTEVKNSVV
jgi:hypothetical protein